MEIIFTSQTDVRALQLRDRLFDELRAGALPPWECRAFSGWEDAVYYASEDNDVSPDGSHLVFVVEQYKDKVIFSPARMRESPNPDFLMVCMHVGHLTELLLSRFYDDFLRMEVTKTP